MASLRHADRAVRMLKKLIGSKQCIHHIASRADVRNYRGWIVEVIVLDTPPPTLIPASVNNVSVVVRALPDARIEPSRVSLA